MNIQQQQRHRVRAYRQRQRWLAAEPQRKAERKRARQASWDKLMAFWNDPTNFTDMGTTTITGKFFRAINARMLAAPLDDEIIKVVGIHPDGMSVTSIRDNHQQVHEMTFPQGKE